MAPFGLKLLEKAFQMIPDILFFDVENEFGRKIGKLPVSEDLWFFLDVISRCASKNDPQSFDFQLSTTFGGGVKEIVSIFAPDFRPKMTSRLLVFWLEDARPDVAYQETLFLVTAFEIRFQEKQLTV